jgi:hypothetical protein
MVERDTTPSDNAGSEYPRKKDVWGFNPIMTFLTGMLAAACVAGLIIGTSSRPIPPPDTRMAQIAKRVGDATGDDYASVTVYRSGRVSISTGLGKSDYVWANSLEEAVEELRNKSARMQEALR